MAIATALAQAASRWGDNALAFAGAVRARPTLAAVTAEAFITRFGFGMVGFAFPLYALSLGMGMAEIGLLYTMRTGTTVMVKPPIGWAADRFGRKRTLILAVAFRCLIGPLLIVASTPWHLYLLRVLMGAGTAAREPSINALIAEHGDKRSMAAAFAWYHTARDLGHSLGIAAAGLLIQAFGSYALVFLVASITSCAGLVTVVRYVRENREIEERPTAAPADPAPSRSPAVARPAPTGGIPYAKLSPYAAFGLMIGGSTEMMKGLFPVIAIQYANLTPAQAGLAVSGSAIAVPLAGPLFGWLSDHVSRTLALASRSVANTASSLLYLFFPSFGGFFVAYVVDDTGKTAFRPTWGAVLAEISEGDPARRARTMTFVDSAYTLGEAIGPLVAGLLIAAFGVPGMLGVRAALSLATEAQALRLKPGAPSGRGVEMTADRVDLKQALANLTVEERYVIILREVDRLPWEEIAKKPGLSVAAVKDLHRHALLQLSATERNGKLGEP